MIYEGAFPQDKKYTVISADPAWTYKQAGNTENSRGNAIQHYPTMTVQEVCDLPVESITDDNAFLFLWVTFPLIYEVQPVFEAWGFKYTTLGFNWVKTNRKSGGWHTGCGAYTRSNSEVCLLGTRGKRAHDIVQSRSVHSVLSDPYLEHSKKPDEYRRRVDTLCGVTVPKIELFCRDPWQGWDSWGIEISGRIRSQEKKPDYMEQGQHLFL